MIGLKPGDAKIFRNPGGRVTHAALEALVLGVHLLGVQRVLVVPHTRCAMATSSEEDLRTKVSAASGQNAAWARFSVISDQAAALRDDVARVKAKLLIPARIAVGGFMYDVDTGRLGRLV